MYPTTVYNRITYRLYTKNVQLTAFSTSFNFKHRTIPETQIGEPSCSTDSQVIVPETQDQSSDSQLREKHSDSQIENIVIPETQDPETQDEDSNLM